MYRHMSRLIRRPVILGATLVLSLIALLRFNVPATILVMVVGVTTAVLVGRHQAGLFKIRIRPRGRREPVWKPKNHHKELPAPADDPVIASRRPLRRHTYITRTGSSVAFDAAVRLEIQSAHPIHRW